MVAKQGKATMKPCVVYQYVKSCIKGEVRSKIKLSHFVVFGALIRMVLVRGASEQPFLRYSNFKDYQIWESLFMSR